MALTTKDSILGFSDRQSPTRVHIKSWDQDVFLVDPTADIRDEWEVFCQANQGKPASWRAKLASLLLCDEEGNRLFTAADVSALGQRKASALHEIWQAGLPLMRITDEEVQELAGN